MADTNIAFQGAVISQALNEQNQFAASAHSYPQLFIFYIVALISVHCLKLVVFIFQFFDAFHDRGIHSVEFSPDISLAQRIF